MNADQDQAPDWTPDADDPRPPITVEAVICEDASDTAYFYDTYGPVDSVEDEWMQARTSDLLELGAMR
ncbi:hypothetical protein [Haloarcula argentinensis]|uniref:Uncharacterized protein n=1 Tax=Haloarcula argentinensis TaxID=43776 RepID=A0A847U7X6_HALAR|nr:hypothetical protein [Haloarcula argentinensis]NLV14382.1 hypothetical protein [Haloarcula argentinensis]